MRRWLKLLVPGKMGWKKLALTATAAGLLVAAFCWGRWGALSEATANPPAAGLGESVPSWAQTNSEYDRRPVAYIYNSIPVTRAELGEYLIARYGPERVEFLVNRRIIDHECQVKGISVSDAEVEAQLVEDLRSMNVTRIEDFINQVLKRFNKTLYEYKEDVIRPRLAMIKLVRPTISITEKDLQDAFEAHYGEKVHCRMIVLPKSMNDHQKLEVCTKVKASDEEFRQQARTQFIPALATKEGDAPPIHRHFGDENIEKTAFSLRPGEVSGVLDMKDGTAVILKCIEHLDPDKTHRLEDERLKLHKEVEEVRLLQDIPPYFQKLKEQADARIFLRRDGSPEEVVRRANQMLRASAPAQPAMPPAPVQAAMPPAPRPTPPQGN